MTDTARTPHPPAYRAVLAEQFRTVGLAAWREAAAITALLAIAAVAAIAARVGASEAAEGQPAGMPVFVIVGFLAPFVFWKGEKPFGASHLWTLPVDRRRHAVAKALTGWAWLMLSIAGFLGWLVAVTLLSGGTVGAEETRLMLPPGWNGEPVSRALAVSWTTPWQWAVPFTAGTIAYLFGTALLLGTRRPLRWGAALLASFVVLSALATAEGHGGWLGTGARALFNGPVGLDGALSGGVGLSTEVVTTDGQLAVAWEGVQTARRWLQSTAVWMLLGGFALWAALRRHREA